MTDDDQAVAALWALWDGTAALFLACVAVACILLAVHVAALHGRRVASVQSLRTSTAIALGPMIALPPLLLWPVDLLKVYALAAVAGATIFTWREDRLGDLGALLTSGAVAWSAFMGGLLILEPDVGVDYRHGLLTGGLALVVIGVFLALFPPARPPRPITPADRYFWIDRSIGRAVALGPFRTPTVLAAVVSSAVLVLVFLALAPAIGRPGAAIAALAAFCAAAGAALVAGTPRVVARARRANDATSAEDRRTEAAALGRYPPITMEQLRGLVDELPDADVVRPLRVEVLIAGGRLDEARDHLERLPAGTPDERLTRASLAELWSVAAEDADRRDEIRAVLDEARSADMRRRAEVALAYADARRHPEPGTAALEPIARLGPGSPGTALPVWFHLVRWFVPALALVMAAGLSLQIALMLSRL